MRILRRRLPTLHEDMVRSVDKNRGSLAAMWRGSGGEPEGRGWSWEATETVLTRDGDDLD